MDRVAARLPASPAGRSAPEVGRRWSEGRVPPPEGDAGTAETGPEHHFIVAILFDPDVSAAFGSGLEVVLKNLHTRNHTLR